MLSCVSRLDGIVKLHKALEHHIDWKRHVTTVLERSDGCRAHFQQVRALQKQAAESPLSCPQLEEIAILVAGAEDWQESCRRALCRSGLEHLTEDGAVCYSRSTLMIAEFKESLPYPEMKIY